MLARAASALRLVRLRATLPLLFRREALPDLLRRLDAPGGANGLGADPVEAAVSRLFRPLRFWPTTCLWRALGGYAALRAAGVDARFFIGVRPKAGAPGEIEAHAWLEREGRPSIGAPRAEDGYRIAFAWPVDPGTLPSVLRPRGASRRYAQDERMSEVEDERMSGIEDERTSSVPGLHPSEDAILTELGDGTGVLLDLRTRFYFTLNPTGVLTWKLLAAGGADAGVIAQGVAGAYPDADPEAVRRDVEALLAELRREGLVLERPAP